VNINHANALGITTSPPVRSGKISAASRMTHRDGVFRTNEAGMCCRGARYRAPC
jgi:hypothetical protein